MLETTNGGATDTRKLVLGFDGDCVICSALARRIEEQVGNKLEVRGLREPQVDHWRKKALGEGAPWAPTLFEVRGTRVEAWTGWRMGIYLSRLLGPVATWQIMQVLGEIKAASNRGTPGFEPSAGMSRGRFIKGVAGAAVAVSLLSTPKSLPAAEAAEVEGDVDDSLPGIVNSEELEGGRLARTARKALDRADVRNVLSKETLAENGVNLEEAKVTLHDLQGDNKLVSVALVLSAERVLHFQAYSKPVQRVRSEARVLKVEDEDIILERASINGELVRDSDQEALSTAASCDRRCRFPYDSHLRWTCVRWRWGCVIATCYACYAAACLTGNVPGCLACILASCPYAARNCCRRRGWKCVLC